MATIYNIILSEKTLGKIQDIQDTVSRKTSRRPSIQETTRIIMLYYLGYTSCMSDRIFDAIDSYYLSHQESANRIYTEILRSASSM